MGHLSNPIGFRLSFEKKWNFTFFIKNLYYPEAVNTLINIRDYLYYYFTRKKLLQSGLCLSHFIICKYFKKLYITVYLYHIDLEKTSYDLINKLFATYYDSYNLVNCKFIPNKTAKQLNIYHKLRDLSNSDLFLFLYTFQLFFNKDKDLEENNYNTEQNIFLNKKLKNYNKFIIYYYTRQWMRFYSLHISRIYLTSQIWRKYKRLMKFKKNSYNNIKNIYIDYVKAEKKDDIETNSILNYYLNYNLNNKNEKLNKIKGLILYKAKKLLKFKPYYKTIIQKSSFLKNLIIKKSKWGLIKLAWQITKITLKKQKKNIKNIKNIKYFIKLKSEKKQIYKYLKYFLLKFKYLCFFKAYKHLKYIKSILNNKNRIKNVSSLFSSIFFDRYFPKIYKSIKQGLTTYTKWSDNYKTDNYKLDLYTVFVYLAKKMRFKKVRNSHNLWDKWIVIYRYLYWFYKLKVLRNDNINTPYFLFYMKSCMLYSWYGTYGLKARFKKSKGFFEKPYKLNRNEYPFNFKKHIFYCIHYGIYLSFFKKAFLWMTYFLKFTVFIINNAKDIDNINNIKFQYSFITNNNVTAPFLARYIVLKLKRGFTIVKTLNPLKRELGRLTKANRRNQLPYLYNNAYKVNKIKLQSITLYKKTFNYYLGTCSTYFYLLCNKYYYNNDILLFPNIYFFYKKNKKKKSKIPYLFKLKNIFKIIFVKYTHYKKKQQHYFNFIKKFKLVNKKKRLQQYKKYKKLKKGYMLYPLVSNIEKKIIFYTLPLGRNLYSFFNNCFFTVLNFFLNIEKGLKLKKKKINNLQIFFSSFLHKNYINYTMLKTLLWIYQKLNIRNERDLYIPKYKTYLMGYKFVFRGRFSRKQRASKATLLMGKVPLNTLNVKVDYVFMTVTLKNSAISFKLYLYRNEILSGHNVFIKI